MKPENHYRGFEYSAKELYKFIAVSDFFTIMLNDGRIIHYTAQDYQSFHQWLLDNKIKDIRKEDGWIIS